MSRKIDFYQKYISKLKGLVEEDEGVADLFTELKEEEGEDEEMWTILNVL